MCKLPEEEWRRYSEQSTIFLLNLKMQALQNKVVIGYCLYTLSREPVRKLKTAIPCGEYIIISGN